MELIINDTGNRTLATIKYEGHEWDRATEGYIRIYIEMRQTPHTVRGGFKYFADHAETMPVAYYQHPEFQFAIYKEAQSLFFGLRVEQGSSWPESDRTMQGFLEFFPVHGEILPAMFDEIIVFMRALEDEILPPWWR